MANILIIDDDDAVRDYLSALVTRLGHTSIPVATCADALVRLADPAVQIIIADIYLPDSPSFEEWVDQLKKNAADRPLIVITGEPSDKLVSMAQGGEILAFLTKPFELAFIKNLLAEATHKISGSR